MIKRIRNHSIYEIWCDHTSESVFITHKPNQAQLEYIRHKEQWPAVGYDGKPIKLRVFKLAPLYANYI